MHEKILINIASYRERELENTVRSLYENATHKDRLLFSIVSQDYEHPDLSFIPKLNLRYIKILPEDGFGAAWARSIAFSMFSSFDYYFQTDGHVMASPEWDQKIIRAYEKASDRYKKDVVLTAYPASYALDESGERRIIVSEHCAPDVKDVQFRDWPNRTKLDHLSQVFYLQAACVFSSRKHVEDVPMDPEVDFFVEEPLWSIRTHAKGYVMVHFEKPIFYHFYATDRIKIQSNIKPWNDGHPLVDHYNDFTRGNKVAAGEVTGIYGLSKFDVQSFCNKTGYVIPEHPTVKSIIGML
jgi:hypothetical protein